MEQSASAMIKMLRRMTVTELRQKYQQVFGEPCRSYNKDYLWKRIAWRIQADAEGGLSERAKRRAQELARESDLRVRAPRGFLEAGDEDDDGNGTAEKGQVSRRFHVDRRLPPPGSTLIREYRGERIEVTVLPNGFEHKGVPYRTLSAVAKAVTGSHWNGYAFFGLNGKGRKKRSR
ncbi:MAG: DUF2924 domain-containing protein [Chloroflexota bacterium]